MKVALVIFTAKGFGGGNKFAADLASALNGAGHDVAVCAWDRPEPGRSHEELLDIPSTKWFVPGYKYNLGKLYKITFNLGSAIRRSAEKFKPDIVINTTTEPSVLRAVPPGIKRISYVHYPTELTAYGHSLKYEIYRSIYWWLHHRAIKTLDAVVCNSNYIKEITYLMWKCSLPDKAKYHAIYPCVDVRRFEGEMKRERRACYVGRIDRNKGIDMVIDAFLKAGRCVPEVRLDIVGGVKGSPWAESYYPSLVSRLRVIGDERISLNVDVPSSEIVRVLLTSRCMANYNPEEHFGIVPVEAMAAGTPPIVADGGGQRETVIHGETGYLVHSTDEMAEAMMALLSDDDAFERMSRAGRSRAKDIFSREVFARKWQDLFDAIM